MCRTHHIKVTSSYTRLNEPNHPIKTGFETLLSPNEGKRGSFRNVLLVQYALDKGQCSNILVTCQPLYKLLENTDKGENVMNQAGNSRPCKIIRKFRQAYANEFDREPASCNTSNIN
jgi:hypothetical protein